MVPVQVKNSGSGPAEKDDEPTVEKSHQPTVPKLESKPHHEKSKASRRHAKDAIASAAESTDAVEQEEIGSVGESVSGSRRRKLHGNDERHRKDKDASAIGRLREMEETAKKPQKVICLIFLQLIRFSYSGIHCLASNSC